MAWKELRGTRRIDDKKPTHIDYVISFIGLPADTVPTGGQVIGDVESGKSLSATGLHAEPVTVQVSDVYRTQSDVNSIVTCRFRGFYVET